MSLETPHPNVYGVDHITIAVRDLEQAVPLWEKILGTKAVIRDIPQSGLREALFWVGGVQIQLSCHAAPGQRYFDFVTARGEGLNHFAVAVHNLEAALRLAQDLGLKVRYRGGGPADRPHQSHEGQISFLEPESLNGVQLELLQRYTKGSPPRL
jgi:methylmalonyl-CoA/ethylmalonyl-CoA epimerase